MQVVDVLLTDFLNVLAAFVLGIAGSIAFLFLQSQVEKLRTMPKYLQGLVLVALLFTSAGLYTLAHIFTHIDIVPTDVEVPLPVPRFVQREIMLHGGTVSVMSAALLSVSLVLLSWIINIRLPFLQTMLRRKEDVEKLAIVQRLSTLNSDLYASLPSFTIIAYKLIASLDLAPGMIGFSNRSTLATCTVIQALLVAVYQKVVHSMMISDIDRIASGHSVLSLPSRVLWRLGLMIPMVLNTTIIIWI